MDPDASYIEPLIDNGNSENPKKDGNIHVIVAGGNNMSADSGGRDGESIRGLFTTELSKQLWLAGPMIAVNFLEYSLLVVSVMFVGHLGELSLAGAALASSFAAVSGLSLLVGMGCALETLCGQSFGAKKLSDGGHLPSERNHCPFSHCNTSRCDLVEHDQYPDCTWPGPRDC